MRMDLLGLHVQSPFIAKSAALLQITAILLIQFYAVAPIFSRHFIADAHVIGAHAKCCCSPEKIASHTCCCCQTKRPGFPASASDGSDSSSGEAKHAEHMAVVHSDDDRSLPACCRKAISRRVQQARTESGQAEAANPEKPGCCNKTTGKGETLGKDGHNRLIPCICSTPCGGDPAFISVSLEKLKFLRPAIRHFQPAAFTAGYPFLPQTVYQGRIPEPPDPPPRLSILT
jgi:hypothetical protein